MLRPIRVLLTQIRTYKNNSVPKSWKPEGVKYGLITYYPRHPNHVDPPIKPTKLLLVERVKPFKGNPYWEKNVLINLGLDSEKKVKHETIVKNTPEICAMLWSIKHLIKVTPIEIPENLPDIDSASTYLHENGNLLVFPPIDQNRLNATKKFLNNPKRMDGDTLQEKMRLKWLSTGLEEW